jgi:hypothetical protein
MPCAFDSNSCSKAMSVADTSGLQSHHAMPKFLGGDPNQHTLLRLCPNHHVRQHSLLRYLVECYERAVVPSGAVLRRFTAGERSTAQFAVSQWVAAGAVPVTEWNVDPAVPLTRPT